MSRFTVGQEITPKSDGAFLTYGKFYRIVGWSHGNAVVVDNCGHRHEMPDDYSLTREEYEQAEREKDPFAPGKWVVCVKDDTPLKSGDIISVKGAHFSGNWASFTVEVKGRILGMSKCQFRPATPEEIKEQEMKIMDEKQADEARANRQTFTVGGQEFYVGQTVWASADGVFAKVGTKLTVCGRIDVRVDGFSVAVRECDGILTFACHVDGIATTEPKPHEWKFGDWARHPELGVVFVTSGADADGDIEAVRRDGEGVCLGAEELTYISTAEIPE